MKARAFHRALAAIGMLAALTGAQAATINVANLNDSGAGSLRQAISDNEAAGGGNTIKFSVTGAIELVSALTLSSSVTIVGPGARLLTVERSSAGGIPSFATINVLGVNTVATISGLTISGGNESGIFNTGVLTLNSCAITNNIDGGTAGGGIYNRVTLILNNCTVASNHATSIGGGIYTQGSSNSSVALNNCTIADNTASAGGGIHFTDGTLTVQSSTISGNSAGHGGGILSNSPGHPAELGNTIVAGNTLGGSGGSGPDVEGTFTSDGYNLIRNGEGGSGFTGVGDQVGTSGGLINANLSPLQNNGGPTDTKKPVSPSNAIDQGNSFGLTTDQRGRLRTNDNPNIQNAFQGDGTDIGAVEVQPAITSTVTNNNDTGEGSLRERILDANGGDTIDFAANVTGTITLTSDQLLVETSLTITGPGARTLTVARSSANGTPDFGIFAVAVSGGSSVTVSISGLTIANGNSAEGGGISNNGTLTVSDCTISGNHASLVGGGLVNNNGRTVTLTNCTLSGNAADDSSSAGGAIFNLGTMIISNCTLAGNSSGDDGGALSNSGGMVVMRNCTISGNSARLAGGGAENSNSGTVQIGNSVVAGNTLTDSGGTGPDVNGTFASDGYNLIRIGNGSTGFTDGVNNDQIGISGTPRNAFLGPLQNNGGPTDTEALFSISPAINAGNDATAPPRDQRGYVRPDTSDIGAFEFNGTIPVTLANIATRLKVETGDNALIGGFIVTGTQSKKIVVRAIGPSLSQFFSGVLANPVLELYQGNTLLETNDDWKQNQTEVEATGIAPSNDLESAIVRTVTPDNYPANVRGVGNGTGIALVEVYDLDRTGDSKLANISSRGLVQTGDNVIIGGFIVVGSDSQKVIVRALGPSTGVPGAMANPTLELYDVNGVILEANDDWQRSANKQAIIDSGIPPSNDAESAIVRTLSPGNYTAIVRGANDSTGVAVVEVYALN